MARRRRIALTVAAVAASALLLAGCAGAAASRKGRIDVVASTSVYGQIAQEIGGNAVDVTSIVSSASQDPHSFEPSARDQLAVRHADLIIENGAGYDAFMSALVAASGTKAPVLTAVESSPEWAGSAAANFNEHIWYDLATMTKVAKSIADELGALKPSDASTFAANAATFSSKVGVLEKQLEDIAAQHAGAGVFVTEPVPLYLTGAADLEDITPPAFSHAVEQGQDVAPATLFEALNLIRSGAVSLVIANSQTGGAETALVISQAGTRSIPVLEFSETLPKGDTYVTWMRHNIAVLAKGLSK
jgi:zinc/manganese transport system substrate-binding protein